MVDLGKKEMWNEAKGEETKKVMAVQPWEEKAQGGSYSYV